MSRAVEQYNFFVRWAAGLWVRNRTVFLQCLIHNTEMKKSIFQWEGYVKHVPYSVDVDIVKDNLEDRIYLY